MKDLIVTIICSILGSGVLSTLITTLSHRAEIKQLEKKAENSKDLSVKTAVMYSLLYVIQSEGRRLMKSEETMTMLEYKQFCDMYDSYKKIGGDGYADLFKEKIDVKYAESTGSIG